MSTTFGFLCAAGDCDSIIPRFYFEFWVNMKDSTKLQKDKSKKSVDTLADKKGVSRKRKQSSLTGRNKYTELSKKANTDKKKKSAMNGFIVKIRIFPSLLKDNTNRILTALKRKIDSDKRYCLASKVITYLLFVIGLYLLFYPIVPGLIYKIFYKGKDIYPYQTALEEEISKDGDVKLGGRKIPDENRLVIPAINVDMSIVEGADEGALNLGVWHRPGTGAPGNGNMVLTGHRVGYAFLPDDVKNSTSFYNLDQLEGGDYVIVYWNGVEYDYEVTGYEVVPKTATYIESQGTDEKLTLYTCHPVGQNAQRLVYYAQRINN